jgi:hypothetical protein
MELDSLVSRAASLGRYFITRLQRSVSCGDYRITRYHAHLEVIVSTGFDLWRSSHCPPLPLIGCKASNVAFPKA